VAAVLADPTDVANLLALLKHRHTRFGLSVEVVSEAVGVIEMAGLRGRRLVGGLAGLPAALRAAHTAVHKEETARGERPHAALKRLSPTAWHAGIDLARRLADLFGGGDPITDLAGAHARHLATVRQAATDATGSDRHLFSGDDGEALAALMIGLSDALMAPHANLAMAGRDHAALFEAVVAGASVRRKRHDEPRVFIWGPLEARLQTVDRLVLGGLNEGTWPATTRADPWLSRPMRADLKLASPERRIGLAAHDFAQAVGSGEVILARASRVGGAPTVASRWWQRLTALMGKDAARAPTERGARLIALSKYLDPIPTREVLRRPAPQVEPDDRLTRISVSRVETWIRDPFALLAERILRLEPMPELEATLDAADRGTLIHEVMAAFARDGAGLTGPAALAAFERHAEAALAKIADQPDIVALWRPRLKAIAPFAIETEAKLIDVVERYVELGGGLEFEVAGAPFKLTAFADRVDLLSDGRIALIDHKTGTPPSDKVVNVGLSPQLALEAAIAMRGGFDTLGPREVARLAYWHLSGGAAGGKVEPRGKTPDTAPAILAAAAYDNLRRLIELDRAEGRYPSRPRVQFEKRLDGPYDHLARVAEWAAGETADPEGGE
jgi:ATP-dependent helicase/nuclease subunit B